MTKELLRLQSEFDLFIQYLNTLSIPDQFEVELKNAFQQHKEDVSDPSIDYFGGFNEDYELGVLTYKLYGDNEVNHERFDFTDIILKIALQYEAKYNTVVMRWYNSYGKIDLRPLMKSINATISSLNENIEFRMKYSKIDQASVSIQKVLEKLSRQQANIVTNHRINRKGEELDELIRKVLDTLDESKTNIQNISYVVEKFKVDTKLSFSLVFESTPGLNMSGISDLILHIQKKDGIVPKLSKETVRKKIANHLKDSL